VSARRPVERLHSDRSAWIAGGRETSTRRILEDVPKGGTAPPATFPTIGGHVIRTVAKASHARGYSAVFNDESEAGERKAGDVDVGSSNEAPPTKKPRRSGAFRESGRPGSNRRRPAWEWESGDGRRSRCRRGSGVNPNGWRVLWFHGESLSFASFRCSTGIRAGHRVEDARLACECGSHQRSSM
jgi:hypothetical protein